MRYYKVERFMKVRMVDDKDVDLVPSDWVDITDKVRKRDTDKCNVTFDRPKKAKSKKQLINKKEDV